ncbi:hypothetical protein [Nocardia harenae]|uniref:hypothetical protein n=1 Tax=Nocardia harenae TaxID=358707 RepID=UPI0012ED53EA|nr:hypothetical protein [Nocardia harenae]
MRQLLDASVTSPVFFKDGGLRIALSNGWKIFVSARRPAVRAELLHNGAIVWTRAGLADDPCFPVVQIDPWTGRNISAPPWPGRPDGIGSNRTDDING